MARSGSGAALHAQWDDLNDAARESSRAAADSVVSRLASIGYELVPLRRWLTGRDAGPDMGRLMPFLRMPRG